MKIRAKNRQASGVCLIECFMGGLILIIVSLLMLDLLALVVVHSTQDRVTFTAARMAANADQKNARTAAEQIVAQAPRGSLISNMDLSDFKYVSNDRVEVVVATQMKILAPLPGVPERVTFKTTAVEPVVSTPIVRL